MGKTSKRLFPLGIRRKQQQQQQQQQQQKYQLQQDESPAHVPSVREPHLPLSKAERILGTSGLSVNPRTQPSPYAHDPYGVQAPVGRTAHPNYTSNRDSDTSAITTFDQYLYSAAKQSSPTPDQYNEPQYHNSVGDYEDRSFSPSTFNTQRKLLHHASSTTLRSSYTSRTLPSYISQRSLESSLQYQTRPSDFVPPLESRTPEVYIPRSAKDYPLMPFANPQTLQRQPTRTNIGNIFTKPSPPLLQQEDPVRRAANSPSSTYSANFSGSQQERVYSPDTMHAHSQELSRSYHDSIRPPRPKTAISEISQARRALPMSEQQQEFNRVKEHIRRPMPGAKHWFDSFPDLDEEDEDFNESDEDYPAVVQADFGPGPIQDGYPTPDSNSYSDAGSVQRQSSVDPPTDVYVPAKPRSYTSPASQSRSSTQSLDDPAEQVSSLESSKETIETPSEPRSDPITDAEIDSCQQSQRASAYTRASMVSSVAPDSDIGEPNDNGSHLALPHIRDSIAVSEVDGHVHHAKTLSYDIKVRTKAPTPELARDRSSRSSSVRSGRTTLSMPAMRSPPASPAYLTIPSQYTRKTAMVKEKTIPRRARSNTQGAQSAGSQSNPSENGDVPPPPRQRMIAVTEEEEALLELMRRKRKALANHGLQKGLQPKYATSVKRPSTSHGAAAPKIREQWATARSPSVRSASTKLRPSISPSLLDSFPASPTTFRQPLLSPSAANLPSPPPSAALPSLPPASPIPPVPPIPQMAGIDVPAGTETRQAGSSLYARRSLSKRSLKASSAVMSIDSRLAVASRRPDTIPIPSSVPTPRLSPLTLDTIRLTRPTQSQTNSIISPLSPENSAKLAERARSPDSPLSDSPPTPRSRSSSAEVVIKDSGSLRDSGSTVDAAADHVVEMGSDTLKEMDAPAMTPGVPSPVSPLSGLHSPISPLTPSMNRLSLVSALTRRSFAPSVLNRQSSVTPRTENYDEYHPTLGTQHSLPEIIASQPPDENAATYVPQAHQQILEITQLRSDFLDNAPLTAPIRPTGSGFGLSVPPTPSARRLPKELSINVAKANAGEVLVRRHSIGGDKRESIIAKRVSVVTTPRRVSPLGVKGHNEPLQLQQLQQDMEQAKRISVVQRRYSGFTARESFRVSKCSINEDVLGAWTELGGWNSIARLA